jgi:hypothetical protein
MSYSRRPIFLHFMDMYDAKEPFEFPSCFVIIVPRLLSHFEPNALPYYKTLNYQSMIYLVQSINHPHQELYR